MATAAIFFISGFPALMYQISWQRSLFLLFGINIESVTIVVTSFMFGLGVGALLGGLLSRVQHIPLLLVFAVIELSAAAFGVLSPAIFELAGEAGLNSGPVENALRVMSILIIPTALMGASLPILSEFFIRLTGNVGRSVGTLYFANTLGAGFACFLTAILLFPEFGLRATIMTAASLNLLAGLAALVVYRRRRQPGELDQSMSSAEGAGQGRVALVSVVVFISGFMALSQEILWFRIAAFASENQAAAFALTLGVVLIGIALGARRAERLCREAPDDHQRLWRSVVMTIGLASVVGYVSIGLTAFSADWGPVWGAVLMISVGVTFALWGAVLPLCSHLGVPANRQAGLRLGFVYMSNVIGSAFGSLLTGYVLLNWLGIKNASMVLVTLGLVLAVIIAVLKNISGFQRSRSVITFGLTLVICIGLSGIVFDDFYGRLLSKENRAVLPKTSAVVENRNGVIVIDEKDRVFGGGVYDGVVSVDLVNDVNGIIRPFSLSLWHPRPKHILALGLSMGAWAQVLAHHPEIETLTIVEINPGYLKLIPDHPQIASLLNNPKVTIVTDDARRWLRRNPDRKFDAIVQNTTISYVAFTTNTLSREYLNILRPHLNDGGVFLYNVTSSARAMKTGCTVFKDGYRYFNALVLSDRSIPVDFNRLRHVLERYRIDNHPVFDLMQASARDKLDRIVKLGNIKFGEQTFGSDALEPCSEILNRTVGRKLMTDDNMGIEWRPREK